MGSARKTLFFSKRSMYKFDKVLATDKKSPGKNTDQFIIIHHTGGWSFESNCNHLSWKRVKWDKNPVSVHFVIGPNGECAKIWDPSNILFHSWDSQRWALIGMNKYAMGIEMVWPNKAWGFLQPQYNKLIDLIKYLMVSFKIPVSNILCHHDITWAWSKDMRLRDGKSECRKPDISRTLRSDRWFMSFADWKASVFKS